MSLPSYVSSDMLFYSRLSLEFKVLLSVVNLKSGLITDYQEQLPRRVLNFLEALFLINLIHNLSRVRNGLSGNLR